VKVNVAVVRVFGGVIHAVGRNGVIAVQAGSQCAIGRTPGHRADERVRFAFFEAEVSGCGKE
jgi:hypothetical protein